MVVMMVVVVVVARLGAGRGLGNRGICRGRRMPHVTRAVVRVFQGLGRAKIFDGVRESIE